MSLLEKVSAIALKPSQWLGNLVTAGLEKVTGKTYGRTTSEELAKTTAGKVLGTAIAGTSVALAGAVAGAGSIGAGLLKIGTKLIPTTTKGKVLGTAAALVTIPAIIKNPVLLEKGLEGAGKLPESLVNVGSNIGEFSANPSLETATNIIKENPLLVGGALAGGLLVAGKGLLGTAATIMNTQATKENTQIMTTPQIVSEGTGQVLKENLISTNEEMPQTPQTQTISTGKKRYKKHKAITSPIIHNSIRVINVNHNVGAYNKKYIKVGQLA